MSYLWSWLHAYLIHFGFWISFGWAVTIFRKGLPPVREIKPLMEAAAATAAVLSFFSAHSQAVIQLLLKNIGG